MRRHLVVALGRALPVVVFLSSLLYWVHGGHVLRFMEPVIMRLVYQVEREACLPWLTGRPLDDGPGAVGNCSGLGGWMPRLPGLRFVDIQASHIAGLPVVGRAPAQTASGPHIQLIELSPTAFDAVFNGQLPLPRACIAELVRALAKQLPVPQPGSALPIVMLDMDVTRSALPVAAAASSPQAPLAAGSDCQDPARDREIDAALRELADKAVVIALMLKRQSAAGQASRDEHRLSLCASLGSKLPERGKGALHLATAEVFWRAQEPIYEFPLWLQQGQGGLAGDRSLPAAFPSLGVLAGLAWQVQQGHTASLSKDEQLRIASVLRSACPPMKGSLDDRRLDPEPVPQFIGDRLTDGIGLPLARIVQAYEFKKINMLAAEVNIAPRAITADDRLADKAARRAAILESIAAPTGLARPEILVLAVQDGSTADTFSTPNNAKDNISGAWIHAAVAYSTARAELQDLAHAKVWLIDALIGAAYAVMVALLVGPPKVETSDGRPPGLFRAVTGRMQSRLLGAVALFLPLGLALVVALHKNWSWLGHGGPLMVLAGAAVAALLVSGLVPPRLHGPGQWPFLRGAWHVAVPLVVALSMVSLAFYLSALQLPNGVWLDPLFMSLGMAVHAYLELPHLAHADAADGGLSNGRLFVQSAWQATDVQARSGQPRHLLDRGLALAWRTGWLAMLLATVWQLLRPHG